ncbi:uncharacterized protein METZ01_LOCUS115412, partial [marine metagenome]
MEGAIFALQGAKVQASLHGPRAMPSCGVARTLTTLILVSCLSGLVLA